MYLTFISIIMLQEQSFLKTEKSLKSFIELRSKKSQSTEYTTKSSFVNANKMCLATYNRTFDQIYQKIAKSDDPTDSIEAFCLSFISFNEKSVKTRTFRAYLNVILTFFKHMRYKHRVQFVCQLSSLMRIGELTKLKKKHQNLMSKSYFKTFVDISKKQSIQILYRALWHQCSSF